MANISFQGKVNNLFVQIDKFETKVNHYGVKQNDSSKDIKAIKEYVDDQKAASAAAQKEQLVTNLGNVVATSINSIEDLSSGDPSRVIKGSLNIATSIATMVGGPYGAVAGALCSILGAVISASSEKKPDLVSQITSAIRTELQDFHQQILKEDFEGLKYRIEKMVTTLDLIRREKDTPGFDVQQELSRDRMLYESFLPQFVGKLQSIIEVGLTKNSSKNDVKNCIKTLVLYSQAQTAHIILLSQILATLEFTGQNTISSKKNLEEEILKSRRLLAFLSDDKYIGATGYIPTEGEKIYMICALRSNFPAYEVVDEFRVGIGLTKMDDYSVHEKKVLEGMFSNIKSIEKDYESPHKRGDAHYFQFINHTQCPVKIVCGTAGDHKNGLEFRKDVEPKGSFSKKATGFSFPYWNFSAGGYFIIYFDKKIEGIKDFGKRFDGRIKVFEFALSNPFIGGRKAAIIDKSDSVGAAIVGKDAWNNLSYNWHHATTYFIQDGKHFRLYASQGGIKNIFNPDDNDEGKNGCRTWRFTLQEFDPQDTETSNCTIL